MAKHPAGAAVSTMYGKFYAHPEMGVRGCEGCVGEHSWRVCGRLPAGCSDGPRIIWRKEPYKAPHEAREAPAIASAYKPAHGGYPGTVRLS